MLQQKFFSDSGGTVKLGQQSGTGSSGVLTFSSIPGTFRELEITLYGRSDVAGASAQVLLTANADVTATDYDYQLLSAAAAVATAAENIGATANIYCGTVPGATSTANLFSSTKIWIPEYAQTTGWKTFHQFFVGAQTLSTGQIATGIGGGVLEVTAAIATIALTLSSGNWIVGSRATLWGRSG